MIDLHSHVLPGVDDGPATMEGSLELLRAAEAAGIDRIAATPHVRDDYPTAPETMHRLVGEVNAAAREAAIAVEVLPGGELDLVAAQELGDEELRSFGLGGNPRAAPAREPVPRLAARARRPRLPVRGPRLLGRARPSGAERRRPGEPGAARARSSSRAFSSSSRPRRSTAGSAAGRRRARASSWRANLAHLLASDAHAVELRQTGFAAAREAIGDPELADWLTRGVPGALLEGSLLPPRPAARRTGRLPRLRRGSL